MRIRTLLYVVAAMLVLVFVMLNWAEIARSTTLNLGFGTVIAPLGVILLGLFVVACLVFFAASASGYTRHLVESRQHAKEMQAQRELADKAEASRFSELRLQLDEHLRESRQRETRSATDIEQTVSRVQRELRQQVEQLQRALTTRLGEMEERLSDRSEPGAGTQMQVHRSTANPTHVPLASRVDEPAAVVPHRETDVPEDSPVRTSDRIG